MWVWRPVGPPHVGHIGPQPACPLRSGFRGRGARLVGPDRRAHGHTWWGDKDGCRAQLRYDGRSVTLRTPNGRECAADFPELAEIAGVLRKQRVTLDGELVSLRPDGRPDFARLRRRLTGSASPRHPAMLQVFVLHLNGRSTLPPT